MSPKIEILDKSHERSAFVNEHPSLENYIKTQASQDVKKNLSACYVLADEDKKVIGYYTLSSSSVDRDEFDPEQIKKIPASYDRVPMALIGRLAVDSAQVGKRYGELLLMDALKRCAEIADSVGTMAVVVDPIDEKAVAFYAKYGFISIPSGEKMFLPIKTIKDSMD